MELEFVGYEIREPKYSLEEALIDASYSAPSCGISVWSTKTGENQAQSFLWWFPNHDKMGTFIINGGEQLSYLSWSAHQVSTSMISGQNGEVGYGSAVINSWGLVGEAWNRLKRHCLHTYRPHVRFHLPASCACSWILKEMMKSSISLGIANWFMYHWKRYPQINGFTDGWEALKEIYETSSSGWIKQRKRSLLVARFTSFMTWLLSVATKINRNSISRTACWTNNLRTIGRCWNGKSY